MILQRDVFINEVYEALKVNKKIYFSNEISHNTKRLINEI